MINLVFIKNEFRKNIRFTVIWGVVWGLYGMLNYSFFNLIKNEPEFYTSVKQIPKEILDGFGIDPVFNRTVEGFINGNFMLLILILHSIFAVLLINNILNSKVHSKQVFFYLSKKFQRSSLIISSFIVSEVLLFIATVVLFFLTYIGAELFTDEIVPKSYFLLITLGLFIYSSMFNAIGLLVSRFISPTQTMLVTLGVSVGLTIYNVLTRISGVPEFMKYFSPMFYFDTNQIAREKFLDLLKISPLILATLILVVAALIIFRKSDIEV